MLLDYFAPKSGIYHISAALVKYEKTGNLILSSNPERKWFQFWKPKTILVPEYKKTEEFFSTETVLNKDDKVGVIAFSIKASR
jgi:hypothetical protein